MDFFSTNSYIRKTKPDHFVIGERVPDPLVRVSGKHILVDEITAKTGTFDGLLADKIIVDSGEYAYVTGTTIVGNTGVFNKIGIGTLVPQKELHVVGDTILSGHLYDSINSTGLGGYVLTSKGGGPQWKMIEDVLSGVGGAGSQNYIPKWEDEDTLINSVIYQSSATSNIGINTILPAHTLHVAGNTLVSGSLFISGNATSSFAPTENQHLATKLYVDTADAILSGNLAETGSNLQAQIDAIDIVSGEISHWHEAFEIDSSGEITPTTGIFVSDTMWMLNEDGGELNLEPRANLWRYNQGTAAVLVKDSNGDIVIEEADDFPEDISF